MTKVMSSPLAGAEMMTFLAPAVMWPLAFSASVKRPVDSITTSTPSFFPWQVFRAAGADDLDLVAVDHEHVVFLQRRGGLLGGNRAGEATLRGVVFQQVSEVVGRNDVTDGDDVEGGSEEALFDEGAEDEAADAAETVDGDGGHDSILERPMRLFRPAAGLCMRNAKRQSSGQNPLKLPFLSSTRGFESPFSCSHLA